MSAEHPDDELVSVGQLRDLVGIDELRDMLGAERGERVSRTYARAIADSRAFPEPLLTYPRPGSGRRPQIRLWLPQDVHGWLDANRPGWRDR